MADSDNTTPPGAVSGGLRMLLRLEGLTLFATMTLLYGVWDGRWWLYALLFLAPDVCFLGYLAGPKVGAIAYNMAHSYMAPTAMITVAIAFAPPILLSVGLIWLAHIGLDRALGYGLKYSKGFAFTHLGTIGWGAKASKV